MYLCNTTVFGRCGADFVPRSISSTSHHRHLPKAKSQKSVAKNKNKKQNKTRGHCDVTMANNLQPVVGSNKGSCKGMSFMSTRLCHTTTQLATFTERDRTDPSAHSCHTRTLKQKQRKIIANQKILNRSLKKKVLGQ